MCNTLEDLKLANSQPDYDTLIVNLKNTQRKYKHLLEIQWEEATDGISVRVTITMKQQLKRAPKKYLSKI